MRRQRRKVPEVQSYIHCLFIIIDKLKTCFTYFDNGLEMSLWQTVFCVVIKETKIRVRDISPVILNEAILKKDGYDHSGIRTHDL